MLSKMLPKNSVLICFLAYTRQRERITLRLAPTLADISLYHKDTCTSQTGTSGPRALRKQKVLGQRSPALGSGLQQQANTQINTGDSEGEIKTLKPKCFIYGQLETTDRLCCVGFF